MAKKKATMGRPRNNEVRETFATWLASPREQRIPRFLNEFCEQYGTTQPTTYRWKQDPEFKALVFKKRLGGVEDRLTNIINALGDKAEAGELGEAKFLMELLGEYLPKSQVQHNVTNTGVMETMSPEMIEFVANEMLEHEDMVEMDLNKLITVLSDVLVVEDEE